MSRRKIKIGITGGIGSGKSYICRLFERRGFPVFDCDTNARNEMLENKELQKELRDILADDVIKPDGNLNKPVIRKFLHGSPENAARFDRAVHPCVRMRWRNWAKKLQSDVAVMECALLYEASFDNEVDYKILVTAPRDLRIRRVMNRDGIDAATVGRWIDMQMPDEEKEKLSDFTIVNDNTLDLELQIDGLLAEILS